MRFEITIPDGLYGQAQRAASETGVSFDRFIADAVQFHLADEAGEQPITLTPEQAAIIRKGQADIKAGKGIPFEQIKEELMATRTAWLQENPH